mgnify:FL=1
MLQTFAGQEEKAKNYIERSGLLLPGESMWIPKRPKFLRGKNGWTETKSVLLPSYILLTCENPWDFRDRLYSYPSDLKIHLIGRRTGFDLDKQQCDTFGQVSKEEQSFIRMLCSEASSGFKEGDRIRIISGPLVGQEGIIKNVNRHKRTARIEMPFLGRTLEVWVALEIMGRIDQDRKEKTDFAI